MNLLNELLQLCVEKNATTEHTIHFNLCSHINCVNIFYYEGGWSANNAENTYIDIGYFNINDENAINQAIKSVKELV